MTTEREQILALDERSDAYDKIDRFLRNNLCDEDYEDYSQALELVYSTDAAQARISELEAQGEPVGVFANVNSLTPENGERWEHMVDEAYDGIDYIYLYRRATQVAQAEPVVIEEPNYHNEAMGCGLEDRNITNRYEAMRYGWDRAIERMFEQIPDEPLYLRAPQAVPEDGRKGFSIYLGREDWGHVIDGLMLERQRSEQRKSANPDSNSNYIADRCAELIGKINTASAEAMEAAPSPEGEKK